MSVLRSALFTIWLYGSMAAIGIFYFVPMLFSQRFSQNAVRAWLAATVFGLRWIVGARVRYVGFDTIPSGPLLIASKHQSMLDTLVPFKMFKAPAIVLKRELLAMPIFGFYAARMGFIPIDRDAGASAMKKMLREARAEIARGRSVLIFPEGTRQPLGAPPDYKAGVAALYRDLKVPCLPIALDTGRVWAPRGNQFWPGVTTIRALEPIPPGLPKEEFMARLEAAIETGSAALLEAKG